MNAIFRSIRLKDEMHKVRYFCNYLLSEIKYITLVS